MKALDKRDVVVSLKKKKFLWGSDKLEEKKIKLGEIATKCEVVKEVKFSVGGGALVALKFSIHTPLKGKDYEEVKSEKLVIDSFTEPFRGNSGAPLV